MLSGAFEGQAATGGVETDRSGEAETGGKFLQSQNENTRVKNSPLTSATGKILSKMKRTTSMHVNEDENPVNH